MSPNGVRRRLSGPRVGVLLAGLAALAAGACSTEYATIDTTGKLDVLGPFPGLSFDPPADDWAVQGPIDGRRLAVVRTMGRSSGRERVLLTGRERVLARPASHRA